MATLVIRIQDLGQELRRLPRRDLEAVRRALQRTVEVDAHRWIQWSIRGGGLAAPPPPPPDDAPKGKEKARKKKSVATRIVARLKKALGMEKVKKPRIRKPRAEIVHAPPSYRVPIDTGDYANSWRSSSSGDVFQFYSAASPPVKAGVIEKGRRPAPIPIAPLAEWVRRKLNVQDPASAEAIARLISWKAAKHPRPGLHVLKRAHPKIAEAAVRNVKRELRLLKPGTLLDGSY